MPLGYVPGASASSSARPPSYLQTPKPPTVPAPPVRKDSAPPPGENASSSELGRGSTTYFSTVRSEVRSGAIRIDITNPEQWSAGNIAVLRNQEAKKVRDIGSLIFETPIQHNYEAGVEVRSLLSTEQLEELDGRLAVTDEDPHSRTRFVRFWVDEIPLGPEESGSPGDEGHSHTPVVSRDVSHTPVTPERRERGSLTQESVDRDRSRGSPDFGGGTGYRENDGQQRGHIPEGGGSSQHRAHIPESDRSLPRLSNQPRIPPEDQVPRGCSLHSMEPLREWFCRGADTTSAADMKLRFVNSKMIPPTSDNTM